MIRAYQNHWLPYASWPFFNDWSLFGVWSGIFSGSQKSYTRHPGEHLLRSYRTSGGGPGWMGFLLMVQKSGKLVEVGSLYHDLQVFHTSQVVIAGFLNHQQ